MRTVLHPHSRSNCSVACSRSGSRAVSRTSQVVKCTATSRSFARYTHTLSPVGCKRHLAVVHSQADSTSQFDVDGGKAEQLGVELGPREDDILPDSLADAILDVSASGQEQTIEGCY